MYCRHLTLTERLAAKCAGPVMKTLPQAAATTIYAAVSPDLLDKSGDAHHCNYYILEANLTKMVLFVYTVSLQFSLSCLSLCQNHVLLLHLFCWENQVCLLMGKFVSLFACLSLCVCVSMTELRQQSCMLY